ncbi:glucose-6-phosphate dehydrogenase (coenzyme-F420) [Solirubrobacter sp. CPCC 204708]|uniref:Glucose-6-phosphate dehydrogenase (Coenzyme-F420) n=1 Tax=Solirubrobacter deserti TaxID=2282478 RepID=A0ABT4RFE6_9ACTN|nr:glucose-6-phosphate dehydrogenase (coenzyme-F420) [Solirubrobacter deserti]MBE2319495.1 glucose-6-phosphate dehydrogenase (coenzyme-F420) [Solirubrobacter deserti]MDA0137218.1 glucose-6-phosphate dehydrogenase (coenzyme-F420) [Solirubrobacter deserti]
MRYGYKASAEQFETRELLEFSLAAERSGLDTIAVSDHFQPWRHNGGHAPAAMTWLGAAAARMEGARLGTSVLTPTMRYHPSIVAQSFATLARLSSGPVFLGIGTGEAMNETPATGAPWPGAKERRLRMAEAIKLIRRLWTEERVDFEGEYYRTERATLYERPEEPPAIYVAAAGPLAAKLVGRAADGFICTSGKAPELYTSLLENVAEGAAKAGRDAGAIRKLIEIKVSYDTDLEAAERACHWWGALALTSEEKQSTEDPLELERLADAHPERAASRFIVSTDPDEVVDRIAPYVELGFDELVFHAPGADQRRFLELFSRDVLPRLRARFG